MIVGITHTRNAPIVVVTGSTRCGTSLVMGMLHAGGLPVHAENHIAYEHVDVLGLPDETAWLDRCAGKAVKALEPLHHRLPAGRRYRFVLMKRDPVEQAKSQVKFMRLVGGVRVGDDAVQLLAESLRQDYPRMLGHLTDLGPVVTLRFEEVLADPPRAARLLASFLNFAEPLDVAAMAARVRPRGPECLPGLLELDLMAEEVR